MLPHATQTKPDCKTSQQRSCTCLLMVRLTMRAHVSVALRYERFHQRNQRRQLLVLVRLQGQPQIPKAGFTSHEVGYRTAQNPYKSTPRNFELLCSNAWLCVELMQCLENVCLVCATIIRGCPTAPGQGSHHEVCGAQSNDAAEAHVRVVHAARQDQAVQQRHRDAHAHPALHAAERRFS